MKDTYLTLVGVCGVGSVEKTFNERFRSEHVLAKIYAMQVNVLCIFYVFVFIASVSNSFVGIGRWFSRVYDLFADDLFTRGFSLRDG